jgi:hypothetical protein
MTPEEIAVAANHESAHLVVYFAFGIENWTFKETRRGWTGTCSTVQDVGIVALVAGLVGELINHQVVVYPDGEQSADARQLEQFTKEEVLAAARQAQDILLAHRPLWKFLTYFLTISRREYLNEQKVSQLHETIAR